MDRQHDQDAEHMARRAYEKPESSALALSVVTLGGSPGAGDSGAPNAENPFGGTNSVSREDEMDSDWGYDY
ncbi:MAG: hypothetical protein V2J10_11130 [Wenzhouxiangella sp.]|jgi:hypothetical protein|nr:hypothetical protein [Wenzhouxiangella sp.]